MSPGRCALPSTMFSTTADDADDIGLGLAGGERLHQAGHGGRAAHVALHVLHAGGRLDRIAAGVEDDALADEGDRLVLGLAAVPLHDDQARRPRGDPCATPSSAPMPSFFISFSVRISTLTPSFSSALRLGGELDRAKRVGRLVDQIARQHHAVRNGFRVGESLFRRGRIGAVDGESWPASSPCRRRRPSCGLVFVEGVAAQQNAHREVGAIARRGLAVRRPPEQPQHPLPFRICARDHAAETSASIFLEVRWPCRRRLR